MIIVVFGLPGSGKSFFADRLSRRLGAVYINSDQLRNSLGARGRYTVEDKLVIYHGMAARATQYLKKGRTVVIDATFYKEAMINIFLELAKAHLIPINFIKVEANEALIRARLSKPRKDSEANYDVYLKIREQFDEIKVPYLTLQSENDNIDQMLSVALDYIDTMHERK
jgi:predicted kinase